jgi:hypothetical protein
MARIVVQLLGELGIGLMGVCVDYVADYGDVFG